VGSTHIYSSQKYRRCANLNRFTRFNAQIKRKPFPLPKISEILRKLSGFKYAMAIDLIMGYYHIPLDFGSS
jgi:hypothetical protein